MDIRYIVNGNTLYICIEIGSKFIQLKIESVLMFLFLCLGATDNFNITFKKASNYFHFLPMCCILVFPFEQDMTNDLNDEIMLREGCFHCWVSDVWVLVSFEHMDNILAFLSLLTHCFHTDYCDNINHGKTVYFFEHVFLNTRIAKRHRPSVLKSFQFVLLNISFIRLEDRSKINEIRRMKIRGKKTIQTCCNIDFSSENIFYLKKKEKRKENVNWLKFSARLKSIGIIKLFFFFCSFYRMNSAFM